MKIQRNPNGDTRTANSNVTLEEFDIAIKSHIYDVKRAMDAFSLMIHEAGHKHDYTKITGEEQFYKDFKATLENGDNFVEGKWYQEHITKERHHLTSKCPEDVNLIDVLEMICDCTCAGLARSGEVRELEITDDILKKAVDNTVKILTNKIEVID